MAALYFPLHGYEFGYIEWPEISGTSWDFEALDMQEYNDASVNFVLTTGTVTLDVDVGWSATGNPNDIHDVQSGVINGTGTNHSFLVNRNVENLGADQYLIRDRFMHLIGTQTGTLEDTWAYISGTNNA